MLGKKLKELRLQRGMTAVELAIKAGCSVSAIYGYERGYIRSPRIEVVRKILEALDYETKFVINEKEKTENE